MEPFSDTSIASEDVLQQSSLLLVDDEPTALKALQLVLGHYSDIRTAADGQQALALIEQRLPDLVLLDDEMPGMSGMNLCKHIKSTPDLAHIPIIFVTANSSNELEAAALEAGAADFLGKPISPIQVRARVLAQLRLRHTLDSARDLGTRLEQALAAGDLGAWEWQIENDQMRWHRSMQSVHQREPAQIQSLRDHMDGLDDENQAVLQQALDGIRSSLQPAAIEYAIKSGEDLRMIRSRMTAVLDESDAIERISGIDEDVTALSRSVALLHGANRQLEQFAYFASHDLKAPGRQMASFAKLAQSQLETGRMEALSRTLDQIQSAGGRLQDQINSFRDLSRHRLAEAGEWRYESMSELVKPILDVLEPEIAQRKIQIDLQAMSRLYVPVNLVTHVWRNLISNAVRHQQAEHAAIWIGERSGDNGTAFFVEDAGDPSKPFRSPLDAPRRRRHPGRTDIGKGVGLTICKRVLRVLEGDLWCEPGDHGGIRMLFNLPRIHALSNQPPQPLKQ